MKPQTQSAASHEDPDAEEGGNAGTARAERLLTTIAGLLGVAPSFFLGPGPDSAATDGAELLRSFHAIEDPELRRSVLAMLKDLEAKARPGMPS